MVLNVIFLVQLVLSMQLNSHKLSFCLIFYLKIFLNNNKYMTSKLLISLANLEDSFEILEKLRFTPGNEELNDIWDHLLEVRIIQIGLLKKHDTFGLVNDITRKKTNNVAVQSENLRQENQQTRYISSQTYSYSDK